VETRIVKLRWKARFERGNLLLLLVARSWISVGGPNLIFQTKSEIQGLEFWKGWEILNGQ